MFRSPHVRLLVSDLPACFRFYRDILGFEVRFGSEDDVYTEFRVGGQTRALFRRDLMADAQDRVALVFAKDDVDRAAAEMRDRGVLLAAGPQDRPDWGVRTAHFRDPDGNLIEINHALPA